MMDKVLQIWEGKKGIVGKTVGLVFEGKDIGRGIIKARVKEAWEE